MDNSISKEDALRLEADLHKAEQELEVLRQQQLIAQQVSTQDKFIETLFEKGGDILSEYWKISSENQKFSIEKESEIEKQKLVIVNVLDKRDKVYKGILLIACISALVISTFYEKTQSIAPVIGVVIGLLLKTNSLIDFFSGVKKSNKKEDEE